GEAQFELALGIAAIVVQGVEVVACLARLLHAVSALGADLNGGVVGGPVGELGTRRGAGVAALDLAKTAAPVTSGGVAVVAGLGRAAGAPFPPVVTALDALGRRQRGVALPA